jgi:hypothetical protein
LEFRSCRVRPTIDDRCEQVSPFPSFSHDPAGAHPPACSPSRSLTSPSHGTSGVVPPPPHLLVGPTRSSWHHPPQPSHAPPPGSTLPLAMAAQRPVRLAVLAVWFAARRATVALAARRAARGARPAARLTAGVPVPRHDVRAARARPVPRRNSRPVRTRRRGMRGGRQRSPGVAVCVPTRRAPGAAACATLRSMPQRGRRRGSPTLQPRLSLCVVPAEST